MNWILRFAALLAIVGCMPARAQFEGLMKEAGRLRFVSDRPVTLLLEGVTAQDAVAKLAEATQVSMVCAPAIATKRVNVAAREHSARQVMEGLARAAGGRWRREGNGFVLEPADPLEELRPEEVAAELQSALLGPGFADAPERERRVLSLFTPAQLQVLASPEGAPFAELSSQQQQQLALLLTWRWSNALVNAGRRQMQLAEIGAGAVRLHRQDGLVTSVDEGGRRQVRKVIFESLEVLCPSGPSMWMSLGEK